MKTKLVVWSFLLFFVGAHKLSAQQFIDKKFVGCGLNYEVLTSRLSLRIDNVDPVFPLDSMPIKFDIEVFQENRVIEKVYLFASISGDSTTFIPLMVDVDGVVHELSMEEKETSTDNCWGFSEKNFLTYDVTAAINKNGSYYFSGFPTDTLSTGTDTDGIMLLIVYSEANASFVGSLHFSKGVLESNLSEVTYQIDELTVEETSSTARGFMLISDLQDQGSQISINNSSLFGLQSEDFWDFETKTTAVLQGQATSSFKLKAPNDCAHLLMVGLYYQRSFTPENPIITKIGDTLFSSIAAGYEWYLGDSLLANNDSSLVPTYPGEYKVVTEDLFGCKFESTNTEINCFENFSLEINKNGRVLSVDSFYTNYNWYNNEEVMASVDNEIFASDSADYYVVVVDSLGCEYQSNTVSILSPLSTNGVDELDFLKIYPNPNRGKFILGVKSHNKFQKIEIISLDGTSVYSSDEVMPNYRMQIDVAAGLYVLKLYDENGFSTAEKVLIY